MSDKDISLKVDAIIAELKPTYNALFTNNKLDISNNNIYLGISFVSKIYGINSLLTPDFIERFHLSELVKMIDTNMVRLQASHYTDKKSFYLYFSSVYPQLIYRFSQIHYYFSLSEEQQNKLIVTNEYYKYLFNLLKNLLEQNENSASSQEMKEILEIINLYKVINDNSRVALGSNITFMDSLNNEKVTMKLVIPSHKNLSHKKISYQEYSALLNHKEDEIVLVDPSVSYYIRILEIDNF